MMFEETRREAMGSHHFVSATGRKVFICQDRREHKYLQEKVQKLEKRKANNMKKYDDEIKDWKEIFKQLQDEKEGAGSFQSLIEANRETLKSSISTRKQNAIKSIRRSLAPQLHDSPYKTTVNHQLISKLPSVSRKIKLELLKREQIRLNEEKLSSDKIKPKNHENTNAFLDDAVALYARLRRKINAEPEIREVMSSSPKSKSTSIKETRSRTVPGGNFKGLGTKELEDPLKHGIERSKTFGGFVRTAQLHSSPQTPRKRDKGRFTFKNTEARGLRRSTSENTKHKKTESLKIEETKLKTNYSKKETRDKAVNDGVVRMPKVCFASPSDHEQDVKELKENELKLKGNDDTLNNRINRKESDVQEERKEMSSPSYPSVEEETTNTHNLTSPNNNFAQSAFKNKQTRSLSDSFTVLKSEDSRSLPASLQKLKAQGFLKMELQRPRRESGSKTEQCFEDSNPATQRSTARKHSLTSSPRRHQSQPSSISTTRLSEIISEKILEQVTNAKKRLSISSNQKTLILKSYARMLQNQLQMDDVLERDSPDFSDTPFMRSKKDKHEINGSSEVANDRGIQSAAKTPSRWTLWESQLQLGVLQSTFDYSEIQDENVLKDKESIRMTGPFFAAAGIATRKERGAGLNKLKKKYLEESSIRDEGGEENKGEKKAILIISKNEKY